ncbi:hypothetical protein ACWELQ_34340, partial [Nocardia sp. NPDC004722]
TLSVLAVPMFVIPAWGPSELVPYLGAPVPRLEWGTDGVMSLEDFTTRVKGLRWSKPIAAGRTVTATVETRQGRGIAELDFTAGLRVESARIFV